MAIHLQQYSPNPLLAPFIETYWELRCITASSEIARVVPDGCVDLIMNRGEDFEIETGNHTLRHGKIYLGGALTAYMDATATGDINLCGIRFRPGGLAFFINSLPLHEISDRFYELGDIQNSACCFEAAETRQSLDKYLGSIFQKKTSHPIMQLVKTVQSVKGIITVQALARENHTTIRQVERQFRHFVGLTPKDFIRIMRYRHAAHFIDLSYPATSLGDIAFACGYYDHAHLTNDMVRFSGRPPSMYQPPLNVAIA